MIHYISPYATDGNIGRAINEACALAPEGDWICLRDGDAMFTTPDYGRLIADVVDRHGSYYDLFGAMTNRVGWKHHLVPYMFDEISIKKHHYIGRYLIEEHKADVVPTNELIAGFFMLFKRDTWDGIRFTEDKKRARLFDGDFSSQVRRRAIIPGLYLMHMYRIWSDRPRGSIEHLTGVNKPNNEKIHGY